MSITADHNDMGLRSSAKPLCVDLDGTLIRTDLLHEAVFKLLRMNMLYLFMLPIWLAAGKANLKAEIAKRVMPDAQRLPFNDALVGWLQAQRDAGRELILATASNQRYARAVADHLKIFHSIEASDDRVNLSSSAKAKRLVDRFGEGGFDYAGNSRADFKVWDRANRAIIVGDESDALRYARKAHADRLKEPVERNTNRLRLRVWLKAIRVHQWLKNTLLFVPAVLSFKYFDVEMALQMTAAFFAFSFCASGVYLLNDLIDIDVDRQHKTKHKRPIASGLLTVSNAVVGALCLFSASLMIALQLPVAFSGILLIYFIVTGAYSFLLKRLLLIDVLTLAGLFTIRVLAGSAAIRGDVSTWLLAFCVFFFLSLALVKRFVELSGQLANVSRKVSGRGYQAIDLETLAQAGMTSGFASIVVLALFIDSPMIAESYTNPQMIWMVCPLVLYLLMRIWVLARRNEMNDDPVVFLMTDWRSQIMIGIGAVLMLVSQFMAPWVM
ncbi:MAG: UbiA family prenyltransferase [Rhizobiaceae bacterium]